MGTPVSAAGALVLSFTSTPLPAWALGFILTTEIGKVLGPT